MTDAQLGLLNHPKASEMTTDPSESRRPTSSKAPRSAEQSLNRIKNSEIDQKEDFWSSNASITSLSNVDIKILKHLLSSGGSISSYQMANEFGIPLTTIHRRRKRLESAFLKASYLVNMEKFGWHEGTFLVSTTGKTTAASAFGKELLALPEVISVHRTIGYHGVNWVLEAIYADSKAMADLVERIKAIDGVVDVIWMELIEKFQKAADDYCQVLTTGPPQKQK